ncbi:pre-RNA processing PIH1/Nop17-domain-containing protein [Mycena rebaudengoi]|nr:pre-RNA processing PIH1/Nop17-domain-containing protein [Mycena rebaudengoi]
MSVTVQLKPSAGFCLKTKCQAGIVKLVPAAAPPPKNLLEPERSSVSVPNGRKVFVNIAWDPNVPPPPEGNEEAIQRAMLGQDEPEDLNPDAWFVPVIVSDAKQDTDKAGNPSLVFDCIFNSTLRSRSVRDAPFRAFIQELALQRVEAQTSLVLSRQISTPNIASKGKLLPRTVLIPSFLPTSPGAPKKPLIEEVATPSVATPKSGSAPKKGILKSENATPAQPPPPSSLKPGSRPTWSYAKTQSGTLEITIALPHLTPAIVAQTTLELEARRLLLSTPNADVYAPLDIDLALSDAEIVARGGGDAALKLKRERALDVDGARAEWRVADEMLVLFA